MPTGMIRASAEDPIAEKVVLVSPVGATEGTKIKSTCIRPTGTMLRLRPLDIHCHFPAAIFSDEKINIRLNVTYETLDNTAPFVGPPILIDAEVCLETVIRWVCLFRQHSLTKRLDPS